MLDGFHRPAPQAPPGPGPFGTSWFGDTTEAEFKQGERDGVDTYGRNDYIVPRDEFNGTRLDFTKWEPLVDSRGKVEHVKENGTVRLSITQPGTSENKSFLRFRQPMDGDIITRTRWAANKIVDARRLVMEWETYVVEGTYGDSPPRFEVIRTLIGTSEAIVGIDNGTQGTPKFPSDSNTTIAINRSGSSIRGYFWDKGASSWVEVLRNDSAPTLPMLVSFGVRQMPGPDTTPFGADFDRFQADGSVLDLADRDPITGVQYIDGVRMLPLSDNFDDGRLNLDRWDTPVITGGMNVSEANGSLEFTGPSSGPPASGRLPLRKAMRGDFDSRTSIDVPADCTAGDWNLSLEARIGAGTYVVQRSCTGGTNHQFRAYDNASLVAAGPASGPRSGLRLFRSGSSLTLAADDLEYLDRDRWLKRATDSFSLNVTVAVLEVLSAVSLSFARLSGAERAAADDYATHMEGGFSPTVYGDASTDSRVIDTSENDPGKPDWRNLYFNASGTNYFVDPSTRALWYFEESSGTLARDESPNGQDGNLINGVGRSDGRVGRGITLDGVNQYVDVPDSVPLSITGPFTLEARFNTTGIGANQGIIEKFQSVFQNGYSLRLLGTGKLECATMGPGPVGAAQGATVVSAGTWHHTACVYDGASIKVYLDGVLDGSVATTVDPGDGPTSLKIGARGDGPGSRFSGMLDEVRISARALSAPEISTDFAARKYLRFQLATSDSPSGPWVFRGRDGTPDSWYSLTGQAVPSMLDGDRYYRYRAELNSSDSLSSPALHDVGVTAEGPSIDELGALPATAAFAMAAIILLRSGRPRAKKDS